MSGTPVHIVAARAKGAPYGRRAVWAAIREMGVFTQVALRMRVPHVSRHAMKDYLSALVKGGYVRPGKMVGGQSTGSVKVREYELVRDIGVDAPRLRKDGTELPPTAQQRMWTVMKIENAFTVQELAENASTAEDPVPFETAKRYALHLHKAGYLMRRGDSYLLALNTGGHAPMVQRTKVVFDPNTDSIVWHEDIEP